jgi:undecaprenyl-diphosphatase
VSAIGAKIRARGPEIWLLAGLLVIAGLLFVFVKLASEVFEGETAAFDRNAILALRVAGNPSDPIGPAWLEEAARDVTSLGSVIIVGAFSAAAVIYFLLARRPAPALLMLISVVGGVILNDLLKFAFARPRPELALQTARIFTSSFPSGHAALSAVAYLTLGALLARGAETRAIRIYVMSFAILIVLMIGLTRVYLGVHYPTDVLAGWCIGAAWAGICWIAANQLGRGNHERPKP